MNISQPSAIYNFEFSMTTEEIRGIIEATDVIYSHYVKTNKDLRVLEPLMKLKNGLALTAKNDNL